MTPTLTISRMLPPRKTDDFERLITGVAELKTNLPGKERLLLDDGRLGDLLTWENTPRNGVPSVVRDIAPEVSLQDGLFSPRLYQTTPTNRQVSGEIVHPSATVLSNLALNAGDVLWLCKELNEALLVDISTCGAPTDYLIVRTRAVDRGLRTDGPPAFLSEPL